MIAKIKEKIMQDRRIGRSSLEAFLEILNEVEAKYGKDINVLCNGWIPCSERLPDNDDDVLCWYEYSMLQGVNVVRKAKTHGIGHYYKPTDSWLIYGGFGMGWNVIAWQPLPEPYKPIG